MTSHSRLVCPSCVDGVFFLWIFLSHFLRDILLYESAKNFHGRPKPFNGSWYTSLFVHFYPAGAWKHHDHDLDSHYAVPPFWAKTPTQALRSGHPKLKLVGTSFQEPDCPDRWCNLKNAIQWEGPGTYGEVLTAGGRRYSLDIEEDEEL
jgi:hypothetical protein